MIGLFETVAEVEALPDRPMPVLRVPLAFDRGVTGACVACGHGRMLHVPEGSTVHSAPVPCRWGSCDCAERVIAWPAPSRIRLSRAAGWRMPVGAVSVARPHRYGNPFVVGTAENGGNMTAEVAVASFEAALLDGRLQFGVSEVRSRLRGWTLGCWCALGACCHADVLLRVANS